MAKLVSFVSVLGLLCHFNTAQELTTKCPSNDWTNYLERCYLPVGFTHSWSRALGYCSKYGARLVEPTGYTINDQIVALMSTAVPTVTSFWIGYNRLPSNTVDTYLGYWSDNRSTSVEVGVWGHNEPNIAAGQCTYVDSSNHKWYMGECDRVRPFVCELNPCPGGIRDTFMCNGKCLGRSVVCNGVDDCGNNEDEQNCGDATCTYLVEGTASSITVPQVSGVYEPDKSCTWTIKTTPGRRISIYFEYFRTEPETDFLEIWDGGLSLLTSQLVVRLSGNITQYNFTSSYNFLVLRFVSDGSVQYEGFKLQWKTSFTCSYYVLSNFGYTSNSIEYKSQRLGSIQSTDACKTTCNGENQCSGFRYESSSRTCYFLNMLPVIQQQTSSVLYLKACSNGTTIQGSIPLLATEQVATTSVKQLSTPMYPFFYVGNFEIEYTISTTGNNLIQLEFMLLELCCGDSISIFDGDYELLETLTSESVNKTVISTGNVVHLKMDLQKHWKCKGALIHYRRGCDVTMYGSGVLTSPGYGTTKSYPDLTLCTWTLHAPSADRSVTVIFSNFDMNSPDFVMIEYSNGSTSDEFSGTSLQGKSVTSESYVIVTMETSSLDNAGGFRASFSPGCPPFSDSGYVVSSESFNFGDIIRVSCASGYNFSSSHAGQMSVTLRCESGGQWNDSNVPVCLRGVCGPPEYINNGYIVYSTGVQGGDVTMYACNNGFSLVGQASVTCLAINQWETPPRCISLQCPVLAVQSTTRLGNGTNHGSVVELMCPLYQEVIGAQLIQCMNGSWDFSAAANPSYCSSIQCETPVVTNAVLTPSAPYVLNQTLTASCVEGYVMTGNPVFLCGSNVTLPTCSKRNCSLAQFSRIIPSDRSGRMMYAYGDNVDVTCETGFYLSNINTTNMTITCLHTGNFSHQPTCSKKRCGDPYQVSGSVYDIMCYEYNCSFEFKCREKYVLFGASTRNDSIVRCGLVNDGLWDFGDLRCIGGQCRDPGYPASGRLVGSSFEEGARVTFECTQTGFQPLNSSGGLSTGMVCQYDSVAKEMVWVGEMPVCNDTQMPTINSCDNGRRVISIKNLVAPMYPEPFAVDNNAVKIWTIYPENFRPDQPVSEGTTVTYSAEDFHKNTAFCFITVTIPATIDCRNDNASTIQLTSDMTILGNDARFFFRKSPTANVTFTPYFISVKREAATLKKLYEIAVVSRSPTTGEVLDTCTLQYRFISDSVCATWAFDIPNGMKTCSGGSCTVTCNSGFLFMEAPTNGSISMFCDGTGWDRSPPVCASTTENYVIYAAAYNYKYYINDGVSDQIACMAAYTPLITAKLVQFASAMQTKCNQNSVNPLSVTLLQDSVRTTFSLASKRNLTVSFEFQLLLQDESLGNALAIKDTCSNTIQTSLNLQQDIGTISNISATTNPVCGSGVYDLSSTAVVNDYKCLGHRRFVQISGNRLCLECPLGYYLNSSTNVYSCLPCPAGTYGVQLTNGTQCATCPNSKNPQLTGQTNVSSCYYKESCKPGFFSFDGLEPCTPCPKNFYSSISYSRSCTACPTDQITYSTQSTSNIDCKTLQEVSAEGGVSPCSPNPCQHNGTCSLVRSNYKCTCLNGYTGRLCENIFDNCTSNPCKNEQGCTTSIGQAFMCDCNKNPALTTELSGTYCEIDNFGCAATYCKNNGTCHNQLGNFLCKCPSYSGFTNADGTCSTPLDPCTVNPCQQGTCVLHGHYYKTCDCFSGWTGILCDTNIDDCSPNFCQNGAQCMDGINSFWCNCSTGFHGPYCQFRSACQRKCTSLSDVNCNTCVDTNTENCVNINNGFECRCRQGYKGRSCEIQISVCNSNPCKHGGNCTQTSNTTYSCSCPYPWTGSQCESQVNHCPVGNQCPNGGQCFSTSSGYRCSCTSNYIGQNCTESYDLCARANPCVGSSSTCSVTNLGVFQCTCQSGYSGEFCQQQSDTCTADLCMNGGTCIMSSTVVTCNCVNGFTGSVCETNINECASNPCPPSQQCVDGIAMYSCRCAPGSYGADCRAFSPDFDYVLTPLTLSGKCRSDVSVGMYGDGSNPIGSLTVAFWVRFTARRANDVIMNIIGSRTGSEMIPTIPDFQLTFRADDVYLYVRDQVTGRRRRSEDTLSYGIDIGDGFWHHIAVNWSLGLAELTLYVDKTAQGQAVRSPIGNRGFVILGDYDPLTGTSDPTMSFQGRISRLYVQNSILTPSLLDSLYFRTSSQTGLLSQEKSLLLLYPVDYKSELQSGSEKCLNPLNTNCPAINAGATVPTVVSCPGDTFVVTAREANPNLTEPVFNGSRVPINNIGNGGENLTWGIHGISYAYFDTEGDAVVCTYRLFNRGTGCTGVDDAGSGSQCTDIAQDGLRCTDQCPSTQDLPGDIPLYQTCSMYGMWDEAVKYSDYIYPECSGTGVLTENIKLELTAIPQGTTCADIRSSYSTYVLGKLSDLDSQQNANNKLCSGNCVGILSSTLNCVGGNIHVLIDFGLKSPEMVYGGASVTPAELLKLAVGDFQMFDFVDIMDPAKSVSPDLTSVIITTTPECAAGYMQSGDHCVLCGRGTYYNSATKSCIRCPKGSYRGDLSNITSACTSCHISQTTPSDGAPAQSYCITKCLAGQYYLIPSTGVPNFPINQGSCENCPVGFYQEAGGQISCNACPKGYSTASAGASNAVACVAYASLTTTTPGLPPSTGAVIVKTGLSAGEIVAIVIGILLFIAIVVLIILFCCCKDRLPCLTKKKQVISPAVKDGYYAKKYGEPDMRFVNYNLQDIREKKGKPLDRVPFVEPALSEETGSVKTDISVHVPVFNEKINGKIKRKSLYMSNGGQNLSDSSRLRHDPMTSSPREEFMEVQPKKRRRRKKEHTDAGSPRRHSRRRYEEEEDVEQANGYAGGPKPKALAPLPVRLKSTAPENTLLRPSSALEQPRVQVRPSEYEDFLYQSPSHVEKAQHQQHPVMSYQDEPSRAIEHERSRSKSKKKSRKHHKHRSYEDDERNSGDDQRHHHSGERSRSRKHKSHDRYDYEDTHQYDEEGQHPFTEPKIVVESEDDQR